MNAFTLPGSANEVVIYTFAAFHRAGLHNVPTFRPRLGAALLLTTVASLATVAGASTPEWLEPARAACAEDYGDARCEDQSFLQQEYAPDTIAATREVARRAGARKNRTETLALREVLMRHTGLCDQQPTQYCPPSNLVACTEQLRQTCSAIQLQANMCQTQTNIYCAQHRGTSKCVEAMKNQCDSGRRTFDQILAQYPDLSPNQKAKLKQIATQLETNTDRSLFGELASSFLNLLGYGLML